MNESCCWIFVARVPAHHLPKNWVHRRTRLQWRRTEAPAHSRTALIPTQVTRAAGKKPGAELTVLSPSPRGDAAATKGPDATIQAPAASSTTSPSTLPHPYQHRHYSPIAPPYVLVLSGSSHLPGQYMDKSSLFQLIQEQVSKPARRQRQRFLWLRGSWPPHCLSRD